MMIGDFAQNAFSAIELFKQDESRQFMRIGHRRKSQKPFGALAYSFTETKGAANEEAGDAEIVVLNGFEQMSKLGRGEACASLVQDNGQIVRVQGLEQAFPFLKLAGFAGKGGIAVANFLQAEIAPVFETLKIMITACLQKSFFDFTHADQMYGAFCHARLL